MTELKTELKTESKLPETKLLVKEPKRLDLQGYNLPPEEWLALPEEVTPEMKDSLITTLISYCGKLDAPPRFTTVFEAYRYFKIISNPQIDRLNKRVEDAKAKLAEHKEAKAEAKVVTKI